MIRKLICRYWYRRHKWGRAYPVIYIDSDPNEYRKVCQRCKTVAPVKRRKAKGEV